MKFCTGQPVLGALVWLLVGCVGSPPQQIDWFASPDASGSEATENRYGQTRDFLIKITAPNSEFMYAGERLVVVPVRGMGHRNRIFSEAVDFVYDDIEENLSHKVESRLPKSVDTGKGTDLSGTIRDQIRMAQRSQSPHIKVFLLWGPGEDHNAVSLIVKEVRGVFDLIVLLNASNNYQWPELFAASGTRVLSFNPQRTTDFYRDPQALRREIEQALHQEAQP